jgi:hypothetical protein
LISVRDIISPISRIGDLAIIPVKPAEAHPRAFDHFALKHDFSILVIDLAAFFMGSVFAKLALVLYAILLFELFIGNPAEPFATRIYLKARVVKIALKIVIPIEL